MDGGYRLMSAVADDLLTVEFTGQCDAGNAEPLARDYLNIVKNSGQRRVLADIRGLQGRLPSSGTFLLVRSLPRDPAFAGISTAILDAGEDRGYLQFLENTTVNAGFNVRCFTDAGAARAWLDGTRV
jgi:hypothetical protein